MSTNTAAFPGSGKKGLRKQGMKKIGLTRQLGQIRLIISPQWFCAFAEDRKIIAVTEHATAPSAGYLLDNAEVFEVD
jgi:hypothetical protein